MIELLHIDCMEYMKDLEDNAFDLAIVDPPYGFGNNAIKNGHTRTKLAPGGKHRMFDNSCSPDPEYFRELIRISTNQIIWGANHFCDKFDASGSRWLVWDKHTTSKFSDCELAYTSFAGALRKFDYPWNGMIQGYHGDKRKNETRIHPTQKPIALYRWLMQNYAYPDCRIIDTHLGSGSSAIAAHYAGHEFVGCEIDKHFHNAALQRFHDETTQMAMEI